MKRCPACGTSYTDATLKFCLADGSILEGAAEEQPTVVRSGRDQMRVDIPQATIQERTPMYRAEPPASGSGGMLKILLVVIGLFFLAIILLGGVGALFYFNSGGGGNTPANNGISKANNTSTPPASISPTPTPKDETADLRNQIANLERMINEQKNRPANSTATVPNDTKLGTTARVNSPGDGFLALRSYPSSDVGSRITTIPHGAEISIAGCLGSSRVGGKTGRWCRATYRGQTGWVFDAFLLY